MAANTLSQFPSPDPVLDRRSNEDVLAAVAHRIQQAERAALQPLLYTTAVSLWMLPKPQRDASGRVVDCLIRQHWIRRRPRSRGIYVYFYESRADALAAWPMAKQWPWPTVERHVPERPFATLSMEMDQTPPPPPRRSPGVA